MMRIVILLVALLALLGAGVGVWSIATQSTPVDAETVVRGAIREYVDEQGITRLPETFEITMPYAGRLERLTLLEGESVSAGQVVAQVSAADLDNELAESQAVVDRLKSALAEKENDDLETTAREQAVLFAEAAARTVESLQAQLESARRQLEYAEGHLADLRRLAPTGAATRDDVERADVDYVRNRSDVAQTTKNLEAAQATSAGMMLLPQLIDNYIGRKRMEADTMRKQLAEAEARLRQAQLRVDRGVMKSPIDGVVLRRPVDSEQHLAAGTLLMEIGRLADIEVEADLLSQDVVAVRPGQPAIVYGGSVNGERGNGKDVGGDSGMDGMGTDAPVSGEWRTGETELGVAAVVHRVYPQAVTKVSSLGVEQQRVKTIVRFDPSIQSQIASRNIGADFRVRVRIFTDEQTETLIVPRSSLFQSDDQSWQVFVVRKGRAAVQPVTIGLLNDRAAEIVQGVAEGDTVVIAPESSLRDGMRVRPVVNASNRTSDDEHRVLSGD